MKRFLIVLFALLYIGVSSGITLTLHHCMGQLVEVNVWQAETCDSCGAKKHAHKKCCTTETQQIKISSDQQTGQLQAAKYIPMAIALLFDLRDMYSLSETKQVVIPVSSYSSFFECSGTDRLIQHCTLLI